MDYHLLLALEGVCLEDLSVEAFVEYRLLCL